MAIKRRIMPSFSNIWVEMVESEQKLNIFSLLLMCSHRRSQTFPSCCRPSQVVTVNQKQSQSQTVAGCHIPSETVKCCHRATQNAIGCPRPSEPLGS